MKVKSFLKTVSKVFSFEKKDENIEVKREDNNIKKGNILADYNNFGEKFVKEKYGIEMKNQNQTNEKKINHKGNILVDSKEVTSIHDLKKFERKQKVKIAQHEVLLNQENQEERYECKNLLLKLQKAKEREEKKIHQRNLKKNAFKTYINYVCQGNLERANRIFDDFNLKGQSPIKLQGYYQDREKIIDILKEDSSNLSTFENKLQTYVKKYSSERSLNIQEFQIPKIQKEIKENINLERSRDEFKNIFEEKFRYQSQARNLEELTQIKSETKVKELQNGKKIEEYYKTLLFGNDLFAREYNKNENLGLGSIEEEKTNLKRILKESSALGEKMRETAKKLYSQFELSNKYIQEENRQLKKENPSNLSRIGLNYKRIKTNQNKIDTIIQMGYNPHVYNEDNLESRLN